jgi:23S rRNA (cytosine1962-C5)-methyltransferase
MERPQKQVAVQLNQQSAPQFIVQAAAQRLPDLLADGGRWAARRLFDGFREGYAGLTIDLYAHTLVFNRHEPVLNEGHLGLLVVRLRELFPWVRAVLVKDRKPLLGGEGQPEARRGRLVWGENPDRRLRENGIWYALDLQMNQDASFYLDTRLLRAWLKENLSGKTLLNTFAYTGSLGVAALAGGAVRVVQLDRNRQFLNLAKQSYALNGLTVQRSDFLTGDFYPLTAQLRRAGAQFDAVVLDAPFFSMSERGRVDLQNDMERLINRLRPLVRSGGWLVAINNALFVSGRDYLATLQCLCDGGGLEIEALLPVGEDCLGNHPAAAADPAPFVHSTKIALLRVRHAATCTDR